MGTIDRRAFLRAAGGGALGLAATGAAAPGKTHIVTLSFDDGLKASFYKTAAIFERFGLRACLNVIATGHEAGFSATVDGKPDAGIMPFARGTFDDWNALQRRGHEVMCHTYDHVNLTALPLADAQARIARSAEYFEAHLDGFKASDAVYNFAYNASTPALESFALTRFLVVRTQGDTPVNPIPTSPTPLRIGCWSHGPGNIDAFFEEAVTKFLASPGGWFVFNTHGLDNEGWGPMSSTYLAALLGRLAILQHVEVLPAGQVVRRLRA